jgi:carbamoyl-phosphate synthase large subunit
VVAVVPLTDLDLEALGRSSLPAFVPDAEVCRRTFDKYLAHELLLSHGLPSPPTWLPGEAPEGFPAVVKPRQGSGSRSIHPAADAREADFFADYVKEPVMVQRLMDGPEFSVDVLCDLDGRCLNAIPRTMLESRGGESIKGGAIADPDLIELGRAVAEALPLRGPATVQMFRDAELGLRVTDINARFGGAFACPMYAAQDGRSYPELIVRMAQGERIEPHVGEFLAGRTFTRFFWQIELDEQLQPTGRDIVTTGPRRPR